MTIRQLIHDGPTKANELFAKLAETGDGAVKTRERLLAELKAELELLAGLEEQHLLPVLKKHQETKDLVADIRADNKQVRSLLAELEGMPKQGEEFPGKLAELRKVFQRHVRDEKRELLPAVAKALSEEEKQAVLERIEAAKAEAEAAQREEAERQRAEVRRERERAQAEEAKRQEVERQQAEQRRVEAERQKAEAAERRAQQQAAERQAAAEAAERGAQEAAAATARSAEVAVESGLRLVEASSDVAEAGAEAAVRGGRESLDLVADAAQRTAAATSEGIGRQQGAASAAVEAEGELAGLWLELTREQVARNVELLGRLAAARDWREALEVQHGFVRESLDRAGRLNSRYLELVWRALASAGRGGERKKAA